ncbi:hypothetical protein K432DRAFT_384371 [Lepidopterella palustris CBS 459.81]|uniref:Uncharacterized protein n=1 Tax=Lepidopterella palustris CBS 459.81 TaxID=1314670 RepID=A0A8E2JCX6_9PEZI|nr:hypothetical protein K432DRAFT_384371 [Lepidopterella palustris CBS 459.81]
MKTTDGVFDILYGAPLLLSGCRSSLFSIGGIVTFVRERIEAYLRPRKNLCRIEDFWIKNGGR